MAATFSGFILLYMVATKFVPIGSIWEIEEGREESAEMAERVAGYLPDPYRKLLDFKAIGDE
ncbi:MAG: hypothetical protein P8Y07_14295 [Gemmatimonadales bacterium]